jgi:hypothetical protein
LLDAETPTRQRAVRRMLTLARRAGLVTAEMLFAYRARARRGFPVATFVYYLAPRGARATGTLGSRNAPRSPFSLAHDVLVTECHLALAASVAREPHFKLHWIQTKIRQTVNPDALFGLQDTRLPPGRSTHWFFLELERSRQGHYREGISSLVRKLRQYDVYRRSASLRQDWPFIGDFRVAVVVQNDVRLRGLIATFPEYPRKSWWVCTQTTFCARPLEKLWNVIGGPATELRSIRSIFAP